MILVFFVLLFLRIVDMRKISLLSAVAVFLQALTAHAQNTCVMPPFIHTGDTVAVVAPSFAIRDTSVIPRACSIIREWGFVPVLGPNAAQVHPEYKDMKFDHYAGTPYERASELRWAFEAPEVKAIICTRGGYGTIQLLDLIPAAYYSEHPKWLVGYSDITTILAGENMGGLMGIHGNMCSSFGGKKGADSASVAMRNLLLGVIPEYDLPAHECDRYGHGEGMLVGGNMITFEALMDTEYDVTSLDGTILFVEEVEETMHAIDRLYQMLKVRGRIPHFNGIILGEFTKCGKDLPYEDVEHMLMQYTAGLGIPVCNGFPSGHGKVNQPIIMGAKVSLDVSPDGSRIRYILPETE